MHARCQRPRGRAPRRLPGWPRPADGRGAARDDASDPDTRYDGDPMREARVCEVCSRPIVEADRFLTVARKDGVKQFVHTACFTDATFDPDRFDGEVTGDDG